MPKNSTDVAALTVLLGCSKWTGTDLYHLATAFDTGPDAVADHLGAQQIALIEARAEALKDVADDHVRDRARELLAALMRWRIRRKIPGPTASGAAGPKSAEEKITPPQPKPPSAADKPAPPRPVKRQPKTELLTG